jgi:hypothetical protein
LLQLIADQHARDDRSDSKLTGLAETVERLSSKIDKLSDGLMAFVNGNE